MRPTGRRLAASGLALWLLLPALPAAAQEGGLPQLNPGTYPPQLVWLLITFVLLYLLMSRVALPRVSQVLEERQSRIADDLDEAERLKRDAEKAVAEYQAALNEARARAQSLGAAARDQAASAAAAERSAVEARLAEQTRSAEAAITAERNRAMANLRPVAAEAARAMVQRLIGTEVTAAQAEAAVDATLGERGR